MHLGRVCVLPVVFMHSFIQNQLNLIVFFLWWMVIALLIMGFMLILWSAFWSVACQLWKKLQQQWCTVLLHSICFCMYHLMSLDQFSTVKPSIVWLVVHSASHLCTRQMKFSNSSMRFSNGFKWRRCWNKKPQGSKLSRLISCMMQYRQDPKWLWIAHLFLQREIQQRHLQCPVCQWLVMSCMVFFHYVARHWMYVMKQKHVSWRMQNGKMWCRLLGCVLEGTGKIIFAMAKYWFLQMQILMGFTLLGWSLIFLSHFLHHCLKTFQIFCKQCALQLWKLRLGKI